MQKAGFEFFREVKEDGNSF